MTIFLEEVGQGLSVDLRQMLKRNRVCARGSIQLMVRSIGLSRGRVLEQLAAEFSRLFFLNDFVFPSPGYKSGGES